MAKNFGKANSINKIKEVAKANNEKANVIQVKMLNNENLLDYPKNNEDVSVTIDLENSMRELGFTDPIEVTNFNMEEGKYIIVSGHRRRRAGIKVGINTFPCIIKTFINENDLHNYVLLANSQRDSAKDPLLYCKRYKMHEEYLNESGFKGKKREEIAKRLGISTQQADRYKKFNDVVVSVWGMVTEGIVGMSSVLPMATHSISEQNEIYELLTEYNEQGKSLTREVCDKIIKGYRSGKKSLYSIFNTEEIQEENAIEIEGEKNDNVIMYPTSSIPGVIINSEQTETKEKEVNPLRTNEINYERQFDEDTEKSYSDEKLTEDDYKVIEMVNKQDEEKKEKKQLTEEEKKISIGDNIIKCISKLELSLDEDYAFENNDKAKAVIQTFGVMMNVLLRETEIISKKYKMKENFNKLIEEVKIELDTYSE